MAGSEDRGPEPSSRHRHRRVEDTVELVELADLVDVSLLRVSGERHGDERRSEPGETMQIFQRHDANGIVVRCVIEVVTGEGRFMADVASSYEYSEPLDVADVVIDDFTARVGVMAAFPFVREAIHQTAARMRLPAPLLGLLRPGQVELTPDERLVDPEVIPTRTSG